jgi:hypothetical protein
MPDITVVTGTADAAGSGSITDWLTSIGTIAAAVVALTIAIFGEQLKALMRKPRLTATVRPHFNKIKFRINEDGVSYDSYFFGLRVENHGNTGAVNVEVRFLSLSTKKGEEFVRDVHFPPQNLVWAFTHPTVMRHLPAGPPELGKNCDFFHIVNREDRLLEFGTESTPNKVEYDGDWVWPTRRGPGVYRGRLAITADNAKTAYLDFEINYSNWIDDEAEMFTKGLTLEISHRAWRRRRHATRVDLAASPEVSNQLSNDRGQQLRTPMDESGPPTAVQGEDTKA